MFILAAMPDDIWTSSLLELDPLRDPSELLRPADIGTSSLLDVESRPDPWEFFLIYLTSSLWDLLGKDLLALPKFIVEARQAVIGTSSLLELEGR